MLTLIQRKLRNQVTIEKVAWYRLFAHAHNIFHKIVLSTSYQLNTEYYTNQEYGHCQRMMLASLLVEHAAADNVHFENG